MFGAVVGTSLGGFIGGTLRGVQTVLGKVFRGLQTYSPGVAQRSLRRARSSVLVFGLFS